MSFEIFCEDLEQVLMLIEQGIQERQTYDNALENEIMKKGSKIPKIVLSKILDATKILLTPSKHIERFIVVTGIDKSGKETQCFNPENIRGVTSINDYLSRRSHRVLKISLPSYNTLLGSLIASYLKRKNKGIQLRGQISREYAWVLWSLDRAQYNSQIVEWIEGGPRHVALSKRWLESNVAYQVVNKIDEKRILSFERNIVKPDYIFIIDIPVSVVFERIKNSKERMDRYEDRELLEKVRKIFLNLHRFYPYGKIFVLNGLQAPERVNIEILEKLRDLGF